MRNSDSIDDTDDDTVHLFSVEAMQLPDTVFETHTYTIHWCGNLDISKIKTDFDPESRIPFLIREKEDMERAWQEIQQKRRVDDMPLYRVLVVQEQTESLLLYLGLTGYKEYQCTNVSQPYWAIRSPHQKMANPLALSVTALTRDQFVILQFRSGIVGEYGNHWHVAPSGHPHPPQSLADAILEELWEELTVVRDEIYSQIIATGLIVTKENSKPELTCLLRLNVAANDILKRSSQDSWEYEQIQPLRWDKATVRERLQCDTHCWAPAGHAALLLAGRIEFGDEWLSQLLRAIRG